MAYGFDRKNVGQFVLNAYNNDKNLTLKNVTNGNWTTGASQTSKTIENVVSLISIAGAQSLYPITDSKRVVDEPVIETT